MTPPARTIDLGQLPRDWQPEPPAPWPVLARLRRWHTPRRTGRLAGTVVATALTLLAVTGAAAPSRPAFLPHLTVPAVYGATSDEQSLYTLERHEAGGFRVVAYRLSDRAVRWQAPAPGGELSWLERWEGGTLLLHSSTESASTTTALDPDTGQQLWQRRLDGQDLLSPVGDGHMLLGNFSADPDRPASEPSPIEFSAIDPATGQTAWTVSTTGTGYSHDYPDSPYLVVYNDDGDIRTYRLSTGEQLAHRSVGSADYEDVDLAGGLVLLTDYPSPVEVTAYDATTLTRRWTFTGLGQGAMWLARCGELLCLAGEQSPRALDPATGELVWSANWLPPPDGDAYRFLTVTEPAGARLAGHLLMTAHPIGHSWLVDAGTGAPVLDLAEWRVAQRGPPSPAGPVPMLVRDTGAGALIGELSPDLTGVRLLGEVGASSCAATAGYAICWDLTTEEGPPSELTVWRYRLGSG